jgi:hypothetical protein
MCRHSEGTVKISDKNTMYFELYKEDKFITKNLNLYVATIFFYKSKYKAIFTKTLRTYLNICMY